MSAPPRLVILTGASGSGKTSIADAIGLTAGGSVRVLHFDSIGVPPPDEMVTGWGSGENWQRVTTIEWLRRIVALPPGGALLFEGQMRPAFLKAALDAHHIATSRVVVIDCDDRTRADRLRGRGQPELAGGDMMRWAALMRQEVDAFGFDLIDTSDLTLDQGVARVRRHLSG